MRTQVHAGQLEKVREEVPNIQPLHEKKSRVLAERKKREKKILKNELEEKTHTHTHILHARMDLTKVCTKNALVHIIPVLLIVCNNYWSLTRNVNY